MSNTKRIEFLNMDAFNSNTFRYHVRIIVSLYFDKTNKKYNFNYEQQKRWKIKIKLSVREEKLINKINIEIKKEDREFSMIIKI